MYCSKITTVSYADGNIQRVQTVCFDDWKDLDFLLPEYDERSFAGVVSLYRDFFMPRLSMIEGRVVLYRIPDDLKIPEVFFHQKDGIFYDRTAAVTAMFHKHVSFRNRKLSFSDKDVESIYDRLKLMGCLYELDGKRSTIRFLPVGDTMGYLSENRKDAGLKVNASFFLFDRLDCPSVYDRIGMPFGLCVKDGKILYPPLYDREVLAVNRNGEVRVSHISLKDISISIDGTVYKDGMNCRFYTRPHRQITPAGVCDIVIEGRHIVGIRPGGKTTIPAGGFVIQCGEMVRNIADTEVGYRGLEDLLFAIQAGNSVMINGKKTDRFLSPFYHFLRPWEISYPPAMYPLNYRKDRAPRIVLGADKNNRPVLVWLEGAGKFGHVKGEGSCGASLAETADICAELGLYNAVHLDGGGSAQILLDNHRLLKISDRDPDDYSEKERAIAVGFYLK